MDIFQLFAAAADLERRGDTSGTIDLYQGWVEAHPDDPAVHAARFNLGTLKLNHGDAHGALVVFNEIIGQRPDFVPAVISLGSCLERLGQVDMAINYWQHALSLLANVNPETIGYKVTVIKQLGRVLGEQKQTAQAENLLRQTLEIRPHMREELLHWLNMRQRQCKWPLLHPVGEITTKRMNMAMAPLTQAYYTDDPFLALANAHENVKRDVGLPPSFRTSADFAHRRRHADGRLRIGYLSSDLRAHAIGHLTAELFGLHDRSRIEVNVFYCGVPHEDALKIRIRNSVDYWVDVTPMSDADAAALIEERGIDILIDINGHTRDARTRLLARRPAPIIVNWLGYPGTMGSPFHHYILADNVIIPPEMEKYYTEKVERVPCYQPNDRHRVVSSEPPTRERYGLPDGAFIFACFNGQQKLTRFTFARWIEILKRVENSVLWTLQPGDHVEEELRAKLAAHGVDPARLVCAPFTATAEHLARYKLVDVFLDSSPYGAHTTASDALWMGVPVVTVPGRTFASRVCASLVHSAGIPELICSGPDDYVETAVRLARDPAELSALREKLRAARDTCALFDTNRMARSMEDAFDRMWADWEAGRLPIPDMTNIELYGDIGSAFDHDAEEFGFMPDYEQRYRDALALRHAYSPIPYDCRLWRRPDGA